MPARVEIENPDNTGPAPSSLLYPLSGDADFSLRTNDGVLFGLHCALLRRVSPVMSDMLFPRSATPGAASIFNEPVRVEEDSKTFEDLLSYIYPDRQPRTYRALDAFLNVLKAASKYQVATVFDTLTEQVASSQLNGNVICDPLIYKDPLRVFATAKHLSIEKLSLIAREATLTIDIHTAPRSTEANTMLAAWLWELEDTRRERWKWLKERCSPPPYVNPLYYALSSAYAYVFTKRTDRETSTVPFSQATCRFHDSEVTLAKVLGRIKAFPCPKTIRGIDFKWELDCSLCGEAATVFFKRICEDYEAEFCKF